MAVVGTGVLNIKPKFPGLSNAIKAELSKYDGTDAGSKAGTQYTSGFGKATSGGLAKSGAIMGAFSAITTKAMSAIAGSMDSAIARFDTLNNYPTVMQNLGYSTSTVDESLSKMDSHLQGLPTALNDMVSTVQGLAAVTGDLEGATDAGLALNDMLLASGSNTQLVNSAMEQFRQMLSKGKPDMQDWKSLVSAMPGQMDELAKSLLGPTANANDLYAALGGGGAEATISMQQLLDKMVELDQEGGDGFASFAEQAKTASGGVATSMANIKTAITRGISNVMDAIGKDTFSDAAGGITDAINTVSKGVANVVKTVMPTIKTLVGAVSPFAPALLTAGAAFEVLSAKGGKGATALISTFTKLNQAANGFATVYGSAVVSGTGKGTAAMQAASATASKLGGTLKSAFASLVTPANLASLAIAGVTAAIGIGITLYSDYTKRTENAAKATQGLTEATKATTGLSDYGNVLQSVGETAEFTALSVDELHESMAEHVDAMNANTEAAQSQLTTLNTAQQIINEYAGQTDLSAEASGRLKWAMDEVNDQFGLTITQADVMANSYTDSSGAAQNLTESINQLIEAKKNEIKTNNLEDNYKEALEAQSEAARTYAADRQRIYDEEYETSLARQDKSLSLEERKAHAAENASKRVADAVKNEELESQKAYQSATENVEALEEELGLVSAAATDSADAFTKWGASLSDGMIDQTLQARGQSLAGFTDSMRNVGISEEDLAGLTEEQLLNIVASWDGTSANLAEILSSMGITLSSSTADMVGTLEGFAEEAGGALSEIDISDFATQLEEAGVSTEQLNSVGSANLEALAEATGGNIGLMIQAIQNWNGVDFYDKDAEVVADDTQLVDGLGNIYTWNGTSLVDKDGNAVTDTLSVVDGTGNVLTWNGTGLISKNGHAVVNKSSLDDAMGKITSWDNRGSNLGSKSGSVTITGIINGAADAVKTFLGWRAAGGIRLHADGGIRYHAGGAIATKAVPLDIVGEDGAEAIVPLTNKKYSQPFVDLIAEGIEKKIGGGPTIVQNFNTKVVRSDADLYTAATIINRSALRAAGA